MIAGPQRPPPRPWYGPRDRSAPPPGQVPGTAAPPLGHGMVYDDTPPCGVVVGGSSCGRTACHALLMAGRLVKCSSLSEVLAPQNLHGLVRSWYLVVVFHPFIHALRQPAMMVVMRELFLTAARCDFQLKAKYINTKLNIMADCISRSDIEGFLAHATSVLGVRPENIKEVEPNMDIGKMLRKMPNARYRK